MSNIVPTFFHLVCSDKISGPCPKRIVCMQIIYGVNPVKETLLVNKIDVEKIILAKERLTVIDDDYEA